MLRTASPGRIEFIGNHTDYNGGKVLGVALNLTVQVEARPLEDGRLRFHSENQAKPYSGNLAAIEAQKASLAWANYPLGIISVLREAGHRIERGCELSFTSNLPTGAGLSSSAAIELATLEALCTLNGIELSRREKVLLAQRAENIFVGVPCGILDQAVSCFGKRDHLVGIDCAITAFKTVPMPRGLHFWVFNTNCKHSLVDSLYAERHAECREALERLREAEPGLEHLALAPPESLENLDRDSVVYRRAKHVVDEHRRVEQCEVALAEGDLGTVGDLLFASHASSRDLFENSIPELDTFVEILSGMRARGVIGARLSGGGFGGAVMALADGSFTQEQAARVLEAYGARHPEDEAPMCLHVTTGEGTRVLES